MLRDFLAYAADGTLPATHPPQAPHPNGTRFTPDTPDHETALQVTRANGTRFTPDPLRAEFARRLRGTGLVVHESFGDQGHPIDLAVADGDHPEQVLVAVEGDGPAYAAMRSTRDRDRLRTEQLARLGWEHVRVWSTDLFRDPARDVARVNAAVARAAARRAEEQATPAPGKVETGPPQASDLPGGGPGDGSAAQPGAVPDEPAESAGPAERAESEFTPVPDEKPRKRRALRRKAKRPLEQTKDDTDAGWGEYRDESAYDRYLREQRPPHWGTD